MARPTQGVSFTIKPTDTVLLNRALNDVDRKIRWDTMKVYLRDWAKTTRRTMKRFAPRARAEYNRYNEVRDGRAGAGYGRIAAIEPGGSLRRSITYRVKRYKRGRVIWVGVGGQRPTGRAFFPAGWRAHFPEKGAWNKQHKRVLGVTLYRRRTFAATEALGQEMIREAAKAAIRAAGFRT